MTDLTPEVLTLTCLGCDTTWNPDETISPGEPDTCVTCYEAEDPCDDMFSAWVGAGWAS